MRGRCTGNSELDPLGIHHPCRFHPDENSVPNLPIYFFHDQSVVPWAEVTEKQFRHYAGPVAGMIWSWSCDNGVALPEFVVTTAINQPDPGTYPVYAKSLHASSRLGGHYSTMQYFVAFTRGEDTGARVAFHTVPVLRNGEYVQPVASVGTQLHFGDSAGCIRVRPEQGQVIWDWLQKGDEVRVIT